MFSMMFSVMPTDAFPFHIVNVFSNRGIHESVNGDIRAII